jgi:hypothetical protein
MHDNLVMAKMAHRPPLQPDRLQQQIEDQPQAGLIADV